jgi:hypothetical protein
MQPLPVLHLQDQELYINARPDVGLYLSCVARTAHLVLESADTPAELHEELHHMGTGLWLARVRAPVREMLDRTGLTRRVGEGNISPSVRTGVAANRNRWS